MSDNNHETEPMEVLAPTAIMAMERAQIDTQVATAHQYPRSMEKFKKRCLDMVSLDEETAESCVYCRPVGKEKNEKTGEWEEKYAEGPSIRMAEIVAASYGNIRVAARIIEQTDRYVRCEGVAHDLESNYAGKSECMESTVNKRGEPYSERQRALVAKVCLAKAYRDACFKVVPRALCKPAMQAAKKIIDAADKPLAERQKKARAWVQTLKIDEARVLSALGAKTWNDMNGDLLLKLTGLKTAMADGDETIDSAFPPLTGQQGEGAKNAPAATDHQKATATTTTQATKPAAQATTTPKTTNTQPTEPAKPAEQPAKAPEKAPEPPKPANPPAQETPGAVPGPSGPSAPEKPQQPAAAPQPATQESASPEQIAAQEEAAEAAAGLAPEAAPQQQAQGEFKDPALEPLQGDIDEVLSIKMQLKQALIPFSLFRGYLIKKRLMRDNQKDLRELTKARAEAINKSMNAWLDDIRTFAQSGESTLS